MQADLQTIEEIFHAALDQPTEQLGGFLEMACKGDDALRHKVEALLASHQRAGSFIESSPASLATRIIANHQADALAGQTIGHYKISRQIGTGGMGEVYLATDVNAGRKAALKILPMRFSGDAERLKRFQQEARALVALNHPNILTVYEIGQEQSVPYIASELIEGETLRSRLDRGRPELSEALDIAIQVASALAAAHEAGVVHRDVKPENIMLRPDGYVKVLDFGIAKLAEQEVPLDTPREEALLLVETNLGSILGTVRYMSPEQARGALVDSGTDIWSLGVVLYEMATGHAPFRGATPREALSSILETEPPPLSSYLGEGSAELQEIISRTLRKNREERYQGVRELLEALKRLQRGIEFKTELAHSIAQPWWRPLVRSPIAIGLLLLIAAGGFALRFYGYRNPATNVSPEKSIAVLPFDNLSADKADAFFADGMQDDILTSLGKIRDLKVIARASTQDYRGTPSAAKLRQIARALGASHVLEGSVRRAADRVVVDVALIDTRDQRQVWAERYDRTLKDTLSLQGELAVEIARELRANLTPLENTAAAIKPTQDAEAYVLYLRGRDAEMGTQKSMSHLAALQFYQQAVERDSKFALARARLSICASYLFTDNGEAQRETQARVEAEEALRLQPQLGEAYLALALCHLWGENGDDRALQELKRAGELLPNSAEVPLVTAYIHKRHNRFPERVAALARAESLDPRNRIVLSLTHLTHRWMRNWPEAIRALDRRRLAWPGEDYPNYSLAWDRAQNEFYLTGNISVLERALQEESRVKVAENQGLLRFANYATAMRKRDYAAAVQYLTRISQTDLDALEYGERKSFHEAILVVASGADPALMRQALLAAGDDCREQLVTLSDPPPRPDAGFVIEGHKARTLAPIYITLALIDAFLGQKEEAVASANRAVNLYSSTPGSIEQNQIRGGLALVYAHTGETDKAVDLLETLLKLPAELPDAGFLYNITIPDLKLGWQWDVLRDHPRFQELLAASAPSVR